MARYGLDYKIPELLFPLDLGSIRQLGEHAKAVSKIRMDVGEGFRLLEDVEVNYADEQTAVDSRIPDPMTRRQILTERVTLLGVDYLLSNKLFGTPSFDGRWQERSSKHEVDAGIAGGDLLGVSVFDTSPTFGARLNVALAALSALGTAHVRLVVVNLEKLVAGAEESLKGVGYSQVKLAATAPLGGGDYLLFVNIHQSGFWLFHM